MRTTLAFHLTAPREFTILANGILEHEEDTGDGAKTAHWRLDYPCPSYLVCIAVGDFVRADDEPVDGRPVAYLCARGRASEADLRRSFNRTPEMIRWFEERLGMKFPFPKYYQVALPRFGGAMENISLVTWDDIFVCDEIFARDYGHFTEFINVHEMAHSYFGDAVVIRDFAHAWLKESWATYLESCWYEHAKDEDESRYHMFEAARAYMQEADGSYVRPIVTRVFNSSWDMYDRHLYPGGAWRIHMLRRRLGEGAFWAAVSDYLATYERRTVETDDFRRKLEEHSGESLVAFFDQWIHGKGYPKLKITFSHDKEVKQGTFTIEQTQVSGTPSSGNGGKAAESGSVGAFAFPLAVAWEPGENRFERRTLEVSKQRQSFVVDMPEAPLQIRIDPDGSLLHRPEFNPGDEMLRRALRGAPDVVGRILAAEELVKTGNRGNFDAVRDAFEHEPFWGVRREAARAVGESRGAAAVELLGRWMAFESDPRVLAAVVEQAGGYRDARIERALVALLDRDPTYRVRASALRALGRQRGAAHLDALVSAAGDDGWRSIVRSGALAGLGETRTEEGFTVLRSRLVCGAENDDAAPHAVAAFGQAARFAERRWRDEAVEELSALLRDAREHVRLAAARALQALHAGGSIPALEAMIPTLAEQHHPRIRRIILALRGKPPGKSETVVLRERIEKLEETLRKLEDRLDRTTGSGVGTST